MAIVDDTFVETTTIALTAHTPTNAGTGYTTADATGTDVLNNDATDVVVISGSSTQSGHYVTSSPDPPSAQYGVGFTVATGDAGTTLRPARLLARWTNVSNHYHFRLLPDGQANPSNRLVKVVSGTLTELANADNNTVASDVFLLSVTDATKVVTKNGTTILSSADNTITATGKAGFGLGKLSVADTSGNVATASWKIDNYLVVDLSESGLRPMIVLTSLFNFAMEV